MSKTRADLATLLADGLSLAEAARRTGLAYTTVSYHRDRLEHCDDRDSANVAVGATNPEEPQAAAYLHPVTTREEVHRLLGTGHSRAAVARHLGISKGTVTYHARRLGMEIDERGARRYDWSVVQRYYDAGHSVQDCVARFGFSSASWSSAVKRGVLVARPREMPLAKLLDASRSRVNLKRRLIKEGLLQARCAECGIDQWRGVTLSLQLHHINGERHDNRLENLALLCPNCHSQTNTWAGRNGTRRQAT